MLIAVLHCVPDEDDPQRIVADLLAACPPGSYLAITHPARDQLDVAVKAEESLSKSMGMKVTFRTREAVEKFFDRHSTLPIRASFPSRSGGRPQSSTSTACRPRCGAESAARASERPLAGDDILARITTDGQGKSETARTTAQEPRRDEQRGRGDGGNAITFDARADLLGRGHARGGQVFTACQCSGHAELPLANVTVAWFGEHVTAWRGGRRAAGGRRRVAAVIAASGRASAARPARDLSRSVMVCFPRCGCAGRGAWPSGLPERARACRAAGPGPAAPSADLNRDYPK